MELVPHEPADGVPEAADDGELCGRDAGVREPSDQVPQGGSQRLLHLLREVADPEPVQTPHYLHERYAVRMFTLF